MRLVIVASVLAQLSIAGADPQRDQEKADAEALMKEARRLQDPQRLNDCGQAYIALYNKDPVAPDFEELLFNAAQCFDEGHAFGAAIQVYRMVMMYGGRQSTYIAPSIARLAGVFQRVGMLDKAAEHHEKLAKSYPQHPGAKDGLFEAIRIHGLLDRSSELFDATQLYVKLYGAADPARAVELMLAAAATYRANPYERSRQLQKVVKSYGDTAGDELAARAYTELGESLWGWACLEIEAADGLCIVETRARPLPVVRPAVLSAGAPRCGPPATQLDVAARDPKKVQEAMAAFAEADRRFARIGSPSQETRRARARLRLVRADGELEAALALAVADPAKLTAAGKVSQAYGALASEPGIEMMVAARQGRLWQLIATQLTTAEVPAALRNTSKVGPYCANVDAQAAPLIKRASDAYDACLAKAMQRGVADTWTQQCERERGVVGPLTFASTRELLPEITLPVPVLEEPPIAPGPNQRQSYRDALGKLAKVIDQPSIPLPQCEAIAKAFTDIAKLEPRAEIHVMAGLTYGRCNQIAKAKAAYAAALKLDPKDAAAVSNLGELEYRAANLDAARAQWELALKHNGRLFGARLGLAALDLRTLIAATGTARNKAAEDALFHAANGAAAHPSSSAPFHVMAVVAYQQAQWPLAGYFASRAAAIKNTPTIELIQSSVLARTGDPSALAVLDRLAKSGNETAALALGIHQLALHRYADASATLAAVKTTSYELLIARGIAARGQNKLADAEVSYNAAILVDGKRPEAHFNLGVLYKDYTAARTTVPATAKAALSKAAAAFRKAGTPEAKLLADDCDRAAAIL